MPGPLQPDHVAAKWSKAPSGQHGHGLVGQYLRGQDAGNQEQEGGHLGPLISPRFLSLGVFEGTGLQTSPLQLRRAQGQDQDVVEGPSRDLGQEGSVQHEEEGS